ncbi:hypothetical protein GVAV_002910 [Gurleya vavrai]
MIENFYLKNKDIEEVTEKYKECIEKCIEILKGQYLLPAREMFKIFKLREYGFKLEDFNSESDEKEEKNRYDE